NANEICGAGLPGAMARWLGGGGARLARLPAWVGSSAAGWQPIAGRSTCPAAHARRAPSTRCSWRRSAAELLREIDEALGNHVEIVLGRRVAGLVRAVLERPADEGGAKAAAARRD